MSPCAKSYQIILLTDGVNNSGFIDPKLAAELAVEFDAFFDNRWRVSGGVRWEDFKQAILDSSSRNSSNPPARNFDDLTFQESDFYPLDRA